jgi:hypothetical protein
MQRELEIWASDPVARDAVQFEACCAEWQWCRVHSRTQFAAYPVQSPTRYECNVCLQNEKLAMLPRDLSSMHPSRIQIENFRDAWLRAHQDFTQTKHSGSAAEKIHAAHQLQCAERIAWSEYTDACLLSGATLRHAEPFTEPELQLKSLLAQKVNDTYLRSQKQSNYVYCTKHRKIGDAFPWRTKTQNYNSQCFVCYSPSNTNTGVNSDRDANHQSLAIMPQQQHRMHTHTITHRKTRDRKRCADTVYDTENATC